VREDDRIMAGNGFICLYLYLYVYTYFYDRKQKWLSNRYIIDPSTLYIEEVSERETDNDGGVEICRQKERQREQEKEKNARPLACLVKVAAGAVERLAAE
jgi:hypothetical protein